MKCILGITDMKFEITITGFNNKAQAEAFIRWYEMQGEQMSESWFECAKNQGKVDISGVYVDCAKTYPIEWNDNTTHMHVCSQ